MDVKLKPFDFAQAAARAGMPQVAERVRQATQEAGGAAATQPSFHTSFSQALKSVSQAQMQSSEMQRQVQLGNPTVSIEETMVAMQKAQIGFQATLQVRNKLAQAYTDIMNMAV
ncbi:MAG TPA: flagellar hook-basal body complex protein FliE [Methylibium sp.]|uniref:flagellar hook-basal body complex protein FliE n=1 Tax=Methylibium sp. TaxID=2067992 RepID=UPI002DB6B0CF|nr:flagellar hook-basal body complex protein FliE [Methylibium sp.]HEU4458618.1 flagellar hook-basal body complex protein FliE [Methylibium sp.]